MAESTVPEALCAIETRLLVGLPGKLRLRQKFGVIHLLFHFLLNVAFMYSHLEHSGTL